MHLTDQEALCDRLGIDVPIFAFTHHREVAAAVSRAGGMGVYGAAYFSPEQAEADMAWISSNCDGRPFGVDVMIPSSSETTTETDLDAMQATLAERIPQSHRDFVAALLERFEVGPVPDDAERANAFPLGPSATVARRHMQSAIENGARLLVSALGTPPTDAIDAAHDRGVMVGAMVGTVRHAIKQREAGVDLVIAQGTEAAAHAGDISTMVLVPQVVDAVPELPVLAAGGIANGRQFLAARALGAVGVWCGSIWRTASECPEPDAEVQMLLDASSSDTVRSRCMTGKPLRQLSNPWNRAWAEPGAVTPLPMPLQRILTMDAEQRIAHHGRHDLVISPIGQVIGQVTTRKSAAEIIADFVRGHDEALAALR